MNALVKAAHERCVGHHDIDTLQSREAGKKIPVNGIQAVSIRGPIAHGDDRVPPRSIGVRLQQALANGVFVNTGRIAPSFEFAECRSEEARLSNEPFRSSIVFGAALQPCERQALEIVHRLLMPLQRIEKLQHRADEPRPDAKRRRDTRIDGRRAGTRQERLTFLKRQRRNVQRHPLVQPIVKLGARHHIGNHRCGGRVQPVFNRAQQVMRGRAGRYDDESVAGVERRALRRERGQDASKRPEVRRPHESGRAGCDH